METVKEKLAKLIENGKPCPDGNPFDEEACLKCRYKDDKHCDMTRLVDYLIQNGVTIQEWVSVDERLPEKTGKYIVCTAKNAVYCSKYYSNVKHFGTAMNTEITHWMPLPALPKGVQ